MLRTADKLAMAFLHSPYMTQKSGESRIARVQFGGVTRQVHLDFVPEAQPGDYVMVHVGFAISRVDEAEAQRTLELLQELGEAE